MAQDGQNLPSIFSSPTQGRVSSSQNSIPKYELRKGVRKPGKTPFTTGLDQDNSGDYDPELDDILSPCVMRVKRRQVANSIKSAPQKTSNNLELDIVQVEQGGSLADLEFFSEAALEKLATLSTPLAPRSATEFDAAWDFPFDFNAGTSGVDPKPLALVPYQPQKRGRGIDDEQRDKSKGLTSFSEATIAHPAARGHSAGSPNIAASLAAAVPYQTHKRARAEYERQIVTRPAVRGHNAGSSHFDPGLGASGPCQSCKRVKAIRYRQPVTNKGPTGPSEATTGHPVAKGSNAGLYNSDSNPGASAPCQPNHPLGGTYDGHIDESQDYACPRDVTIVHPAAKACKTCFGFGLSYKSYKLLPEELGRLCDICGNGGDGGDFVTETLKERQACRSCGWRTIDCFREGEDCGPCKHCGASSVGRTTTAPSFSLGPVARSIQPQQQRQPATPVRRQCAGPDGSPYRIHVSNSFRLGQSKEEREVIGADEPHKEAISVQNMPTDAPYVIRTIFTQLAHPIQFSYEPLDQEAIACQWCNDLYYGLYGLGLVRTQVIDYGGGAAYVESADGHTNKGHPPSRMCIPCTLERLSISGCISHQMESIPLVSQDILAQNSFMKYAEPGKASSAPFAWCSICIGPASYQCCRRQESQAQPASWTATIGGEIGCGLLLCVPCAFRFNEYYDGELYRLIDDLHTDGDARIRADAELLHPKGELWRQCKATLDNLY
jgi:hypothetical protein